MKIKKTILLALPVVALILLTGCTSGNSVDKPSGSGDAKASIYYFWGDGCPHCTSQKVFLEEMKAKYSGLEVKEYETWKNPENAALLQQMAAAYGTQVQGVPTTFIGDGQPFVGFAASMEADMESRIKLCVESGCTDPGSKL